MRLGLLKIPILIGLGFLIISSILLVPAVIGMAAPYHQGDPPATPTLESSSSAAFEGNIVGDNVCLSCHGQPGLTKTLVHGDILDLYVSPEQYAASVHGSQGYACVQCHITYMEIPHPIRNFADLRDVSIQLSAETCARCHTGEIENAQNSVHAAAQAAGRREAAVCGDCHNPHATPQLTDPITGELTSEARLQVPQTCAQCHSAIYEIYRTSVHGASLIDENNMDVPTCIDCHGVHNIADPTTTAFRLASPQLCASCHADPDRMNKYGLSTEVLSTYVADFHGTTITLFEQHSPDSETNKPVCYDCHGVHDISSAANPVKGLQVRENLLARCQVCHPNATENFPDSWLSHYIPDPEKTPVVYYVNLFYKLFIPGVLGGMALLVAMDLGKSLSRRFKKRHKHLEQIADSTSMSAELSAESLETAEAAPVLIQPETPPALDEFPESGESTSDEKEPPIQSEDSDPEVTYE